MVHHGCVEVIVLRWWLGSQGYGVSLKWRWGLPLPQVRLSQPWEFTFRNGGDWMLCTVSVEQHRAPGGYYPKSDHGETPGHGVTNPGNSEMGAYLSSRICCLGNLRPESWVLLLGSQYFQAM